MTCPTALLQAVAIALNGVKPIAALRTAVAVITIAIIALAGQPEAQQPLPTDRIQGTWSDAAGNTWRFSKDLAVQPGPERSEIARFIQAFFIGDFPTYLGAWGAVPINRIEAGREQVLALLASAQKSNMSIEIETPEGKIIPLGPVFAAQDWIISSRFVTAAGDVDFLNGEHGIVTGETIAGILPESDFIAELLLLNINVDPETGHTYLNGGLGWVFQTKLAVDDNKMLVPMGGFMHLNFRTDGLQLRLVDLDGDDIKTLGSDQPFQLEARFRAAPDDAQVAHLKFDDTVAEIDISPSRDAATGGLDYSVLKSDVLYARSVQYHGREEDKGLYRDSRFVAATTLQFARAEWKSDTDRSDKASADLYAGEWRVAHESAGAGTAIIADNGRSARLVLGDDEGMRLYQSIEMRTVPDPGGTEHILSIRFGRSHHFSTLR